MRRVAKFTIRRGRDGLWYYHLVAANRKIVMDGAEGYATRGNARRAYKRTLQIAVSAITAWPDGADALAKVLGAQRQYTAISEGKSR